MSSGSGSSGGPSSQTIVRLSVEDADGLTVASTPGELLPAPGPGEPVESGRSVDLQVTAGERTRLGQHHLIIRADGSEGTEPQQRATLRVRVEKSGIPPNPTPTAQAS